MTKPKRGKVPARSAGRAGADESRKRLAVILSLLDNGDPRGIERLAELQGGELPYMVCVTGAGGVGKSMILARLVESTAGSAARAAGRGPFRIGVLAVDPSNPETGGALLGDRVRMASIPADVFFRSVATRGSAGGLSEKLIDMAAAMRAFGCETVFIETVGIGQDELSVRHVADTLIVVEAPGLGDEIQAMKSSPAALADILVVNKADKPGAAEAASVLEEALGKKPFVVSALDGKDMNRLADAIRSERNDAMKPAVKRAADRKKWAWRLTQALTKKWTERIAESAAGVVEAAGADIYRRIGDLARFIPDHAAVAVRDMDQAIADYLRLGFFLERRETFQAEGVETAFFNAGGFHIELLRPLSDSSPIFKFIAERGGGLHHLAFEVDDLETQERALKLSGAETLGGRRPGTRGKEILFLHPKSAARVLLEFCSCRMHTRKSQTEGDRH